MPYYHDLITEKSWRILQNLRRAYDFILIGGWAVYLYTKKLKSKDIDIICEFDTLESLRQTYELRKNPSLKKYEITIEEVDVDIYVSFFSELGVPIDAIQKQTVSIEGFILPKKEVLLLLKQKAFHDRKLTLKGEKDRIDVISLLTTDFDMKKYKKLVQQLHLQTYQKELTELLKSTKKVPTLNMNAHQFSRLKQKLFSEL